MRWEKRVALAGPLECRTYGRSGTTVKLNVEAEDSSIKTCNNLTCCDMSDYFKSARLAVREVR